MKHYLMIVIFLKVKESALLKIKESNNICDDCNNVHGKTHTTNIIEKDNLFNK